MRDEEAVFLATSDALGSSLDETSSAAAETRLPGNHPYRDRRDGLVARRRALREELDRIEAAERRTERLRKHLAVIDEELTADTRSIVDRLEIAKPCRMKWDDMVGDDVSRQCARCDRLVYDVSAMTRDEVDALFARAEISPCLRLKRRRDGRLVTADCPTEPALGGWRALRVAAAGAILGASAGAGAATWLAASSAETEAPRLVEAPMTPPETAVVTPRPGPHRPRPAHVRMGAIWHDAREAEPDQSHETLGEPPSLDDLYGPYVPPRPSRITPALVAASIHQADADTWEIDRHLVELLLAEQAELMRAARVIPHEENGRVVGVKIYGVRRSSVLAHLGIQNGDMLMAINGYDLTSPDRALEAYTSLRGSDVLALLVERRGVRRIHVYRIV